MNKLPSQEPPEKLTARQIICLILMTIFTVCFVALLCYLADNYPDLHTRRIVIFTIILPAFIFLGVDVYIGFFKPDKKLIISRIRHLYYYLDEYGYEYKYTYQNKKNKTLEIYFESENSFPFCIVHYLKTRMHYGYFFVDGKSLNLYEFEQSYCEVLSDEKKSEITNREYIEYLMKEIKEKRNMMIEKAIEERIKEPKNQTMDTEHYEVKNSKYPIK